MLTSLEMKWLRSAYREHKNRSGDRGITFDLTFVQWLEIWQSSGRLHQRGRSAGHYVMGRKDDNGPYAVGNVRIITVEQNNSEKKQSPETREKIRRANLGKRHTAGARAKMVVANVGRKHSIATKEKIRAAAIFWRSRGDLPRSAGLLEWLT